MSDFANASPYPIEWWHENIYSYIEILEFSNLGYYTSTSKLAAFDAFKANEWLKVNFGNNEEEGE